MMRTRNVINMTVTVSWLAMDTLWAIGAPVMAAIVAVVLVISQAISMETSPDRARSAEVAILFWALANVIWMCRDSFEFTDEPLRIPMYLMFVVAWARTLSSLKKGMPKRGGKYWK